jgi:mRNA-degrading endonuclease RelE of RelBE toxin-antitoxin system
VEVHLTEQFEDAYAGLTKAEKRSVRKALLLLGDNPRHPGLRTRKLEGSRNIWEARPSRRLRMVFEMAGDVITVRNVGEHDKVLKRP